MLVLQPDIPNTLLSYIQQCVALMLVAATVHCEENARESPFGNDPDIYTTTACCWLSSQL